MGGLGAVWGQFVGSFVGSFGTVLGQFVSSFRAICGHFGDGLWKF